MIYLFYRSHHHHSSQYFNGSEIAICGMVDEGSTTAALDDTVVRSSQRDFNVNAATVTRLENSGGFLRRAWAYLKINDLLREADRYPTGAPARDLVLAAALNMSLEFNFVTDLTSIVVVQKQRNDGSAGGDEMEMMMDATGGGRQFSAAKRPPIGGSVAFSEGSNAASLKSTHVCYLILLIGFLLISI